MKNQKNRKLKVHAQSGYNYKATPTIILKGQWLQEMGFEIGDYISVSCEDGKLIITPDAEKAAIAKAEAEFMEREMKKLQKEKEMIHDIEERAVPKGLELLSVKSIKPFHDHPFHLYEGERLSWISIMITQKYRLNGLLLKSWKSCSLMWSTCWHRAAIIF